MRLSTRAAFAVLSTILLTPALLVAKAVDPTSPIRTISQSAFNQLLHSGQGTVINRRTLAQWRASSRASAALDIAVVKQFIREHPDLPDFARFVKSTARGPDIVRTADGNYLVQVPAAQGTFHTVETMGPAFAQAEIADSIQASSDPTQQRARYQFLYSRYTALYTQLCTTPPTPPSGCANLPLLSTVTNPSTLENASLGVIRSALQSLGALGNQIVKIVPPLPSSGPRSCSGDIGNNSSLAADAFYGDQTLKHDNTTGAVTDPPGCSTPSPVGILANFTWPNKDLVPCVKEQGRRGTCHIFAATSAVEEMIAIDTGKHVNLSEQDFMEHEKGIWHPDFLNDGGPPWRDLLEAAAHAYKFAYEDQWDYNPSYEKVVGGSKNDLKVCKNYPTPPEPGCSDSAPQEPEACVKLLLGSFCLYVPATVSGATSPYGVDASAVGKIWNPTASPAEKDGYVGEIKTYLNSATAVILVLKTTDNFHHPTDGYVTYEASDTKNALKRKGAHAVHLVGYVDNADLAKNNGTRSQPPGAGGGYFIIKNSYGYCTDDAGYLYMPVQYLKDTAYSVTILSSITS